MRHIIGLIIKVQVENLIYIMIEILLNLDK